MPKVSILQGDFSGGEVSPRVFGQIKKPFYEKSLATCLNYIPTLQGALERRPGSRYVNAVKNSLNTTYLIPFEFSVSQAYVLEFGDKYIRFYANNAQVQSGGTPVEVVTPYAYGDLPLLRVTQSADTMYLTHSNYPPATLTRTGPTTFTYTALQQDVLQGPFNDVITYFDNGITAPPIPLTVTSTSPLTLAQSGAGFTAANIGQLIRFTSQLDTAVFWYICRIQTVPDSNHITVACLNKGTVNVATSGVGATIAQWAYGRWIPGNYPATVQFHQDRLSFTGYPLNPDTVDLSYQSNYTNFKPTNDNGTLTDAHPISFTLNSNEVNEGRWMTSDENGFLIGTYGAEWVAKPSSLNEALTPTNVSAKKGSSWGSSKIAPVQSGKATLFVQKGGRKLREMSYFYDVNGFSNIDVTELAEHITLGGVKQLAYAKVPHPLVWCVRGDGALLAMTYSREVDALRVAWSRHVLGGFSDANGTPAIVEAIAVIPTPDGTQDQLWMTVQRWIGGQTVRTVEYLNPFFLDSDVVQNAYFLDCGTSYAGNAESVMTGLSHLNGETVQALADGITVTGLTVSSGQVTLPQAARAITVGYGYNSDGQLLPIQQGAADGTAFAKTRRAHRVAFQVYRSSNLMYGSSFDDLYRIIFQSADQNMNQAVPLASTIFSEVMESDYDFYNQICFRQDQPLPSTITAIAVQLVEQDR